MNRISQRYARHVERLLELVGTSKGATSLELRAAIRARARREVSTGPRADPSDAVLSPLSPYVDAVLRHAYRVTDQDVEALKKTHSDDVIFETTVNAAVHAGVARLDRALAILKGEKA